VDHEERGGAGGAQDLADLLADLLLEHDVQVAERLVEQQQRRLRRQRAGQRDALLLAAAQLVRGSARVILQPDELQRLQRAVAARPRQRPCSPNITLSSTVRCGNSA
jgi:hypothetical protein